MYKDFNQNEITCKDMMMIPYELMNNAKKEYFEKVFNIEEKKHIYCVCSSGGDNTLYGYIRLVPNKITNSKIFKNRQILTSKFYDSKTDKVEKQNGYEIGDWCLEMQFHNSIKLNRLLESLFRLTWAMNDDEPLFIWKECDDEIFFSIVDFTNQLDFTIEREPYIKQVF